jgi:hypothetical protein
MTPRVGALLASGVALIAAFSFGTADADPPSAAPPAEPERQPEVIIRAQREALERRMAGFVRRITQDPRFYDESLPRWRAPVCFAVAGLPTREGSFVLARLSQIAHSVGARIARPGCEYNFYVVFTPEPDKMLKRAYRLPRRVFDEDAGLPAIHRFLSPSKPQAVRVWHNASAVSKDGSPIDVDAACGSIAVIGRPVPVSCPYFPSRITRYDVFGFSLALVVIDTTFPQGVKLGQLADFAALVGLADIDLDADIGDAPTILRLFAASPVAPPSGLTIWDQAFLRALYHADQSSTTERSQIAVRMAHDVAP